MEDRETYMARVLQRPALLDFSEIRFIYAAQVTISHSVRWRCQYTCEQAHQSTLSPPFCPPPEETRRVLEEYRYGLMVRREAATTPAEAAARGAKAAAEEEEKKRARDFREVWADFSRRVREFEHECFIRGYPRAFALAIGNCLFGHLDDSLRPCDFPDKNRPTFESVGIDLHETLSMINWESHLLRDPGDPFQMFALVMME